MDTDIHAKIGHIFNAARSLASVCDGAHAQDGQGFNKIDSDSARYHLSNGETEGGARSLARMLPKYRGQLEGFGFDAEDIEMFSDFGDKHARIFLDGFRICVAGEYHRDLPAHAKDIGARWDPLRFVWWIKSSPENAQRMVETISSLYTTFQNDLPDNIPKPKTHPSTPEESDANGKLLLGEGGVVRIKMRYNANHVALFKDTFCPATRSWDPDVKEWAVNLSSVDVIKALRTFTHKTDLETTPEVARYMSKRQKELKAASELSGAESAGEMLEIEGLGGTLFPFQDVGVRFIDLHEGNALLADEMGLGKTMQALAWIQLRKQYPVIIICPASIKRNWERESRKWLSEENIQVISGKDAIDEATKVVIINYDIVKRRLRDLREFGANTLVLDECHYVKNHKAQRSQAVQELAEETTNVLGLTGTPIMNKPVEIWSLIGLINARPFGGKTSNGFWTFANRYCDPRNHGYGTDLSGASNLDELQSRLREHLMVRRLKEQVLKELPEKRRCDVVLPLTDSIRKKYNRAERDFYGFLKELEEGKKKADSAARAEFLVKLGLLRRLTGQGKVEAAAEWVINFLKSSHEKLVIFAHHHDVIELMAEKVRDGNSGSFKDAVLIAHGGMSADERDNIVQEFQNNPSKRLVICGIMSMGVGHTLTAAHDVAFMELPWRPADLQQAEDRIHRIGQEEHVTVWNLLADSTVDEDLAQILAHKAAIIKKALDNGTDDTEGGGLFSAFLKKGSR